MSGALHLLRNLIARLPEGLRRDRLGEGRAPIGFCAGLDVTAKRRIEGAGGIVVKLDFGTRLLDAISIWPPGLPLLFFVNRDVPADRLRHTLCHELGHLIMHDVSLNSVLWTQMSKAGYKTHEPVMFDSDQELPTLLKEIVDTHRIQLQYNIAQLSQLVGLFEKDFRASYLNEPILRAV